MQKTFFKLSGPQLTALRRAAGLSQTSLAQASGLTRHAVGYWESKALIDLAEPTPLRILPVLGPEWAELSDAIARARGGGVLHLEHYALSRAVERHLVQLRLKLARGPRVCGAMTRKGQPCRMSPELGRTRCKFHGGKSTGPRTPEGRARIAEAQRRRWAARRAKRCV